MTATVAPDGVALRPGRLRIALRPMVPALLVSAGYVDPGNWGADVSAGARFGYQLVWVLVLATVAAGLLQLLAARLGIASGQDLASLIATRLPRTGRWLLVPPLLGALAVTEVVEVLGVVLGVQLLTGWPPLPCVLLAAGLVVAVSVAPPGTARITVLGCLALVGTVYVGLFLAAGPAAVGGAVPSVLPPGGLPVAVAIVGSVVMPHNILLHSTLACEARAGYTDHDVEGLRRLFRSSAVATVVALVLALVVNCGVLSVAVSADGSRAGAEGTLASATAGGGSVAAGLFAVTLLAAGLASTVTGGMVGADTIRRLLPRLRLGDPARRLLCLLPAGAVVAAGLPEVGVLVWSQVVLGVALPLVLVPLIHYVGRRDLCGSFAVTGAWRLAAVATVIAVGGAGAFSLISG